MDKKTSYTYTVAGVTYFASVYTHDVDQCNLTITSINAVTAQPTTIYTEWCTQAFIDAWVNIVNDIIKKGE